MNSPKEQIRQGGERCLNVLAGLRGELTGTSVEVMEPDPAPTPTPTLKRAANPVENQKVSPHVVEEIVPQRRIRAPLHTFLTELFAYSTLWAIWGLAIKGIASIEMLKGVAMLLYFATYSQLWLGFIGAFFAIRLIFFKPNPYRLELLIQVVLAHSIGFGLVKIFGFPF